MSHEVHQGVSTDARCVQVGEIIVLRRESGLNIALSHAVFSTITGNCRNFRIGSAFFGKVLNNVPKPDDPLHRHPMVMLNFLHRRLLTLAAFLPID